MPRQRIEYCKDIVSPGYGRLGLFHHLVHRLAWCVNMAAVFSGADVFLSSFMIILTFLQSVLSFLYSTDIAVCNFWCFCFNIFCIRRHPRRTQEDHMSMEASWMYKECRVGMEELQLVPEPWRGVETGVATYMTNDNMKPYRSYLYLTKI